MLIKTTLIILLAFLAILGCNDNDGEDICIPNEELTNTDCLAEDLIFICEPQLCGTTIDGVAADFFVPQGNPPEENCDAPDCQTLICDGLVLTDLLLVDGSLEGFLESDGEEFPIEFCNINP
jgi:hypothetical protein